MCNKAKATFFNGPATRSNARNSELFCEGYIVSNKKLRHWIKIWPQQNSITVIESAHRQVRIETKITNTNAQENLCKLENPSRKINPQC